jgi:hypothetical protein
MTLAVRLRCGVPERRTHTLAQRSIEILVGRLVTDEAFRHAFAQDAVSALGVFMQSGHELNAVEIQALTASGSSFWDEIAERIDPRLQRIALR